MFLPYILYFTLVFPFPSILATPTVKQWGACTSNYISPCVIPAHTFPWHFLTGCLCTNYLISNVPPAVYKTTNNNNFKKTQLLLPNLNLHYTRERVCLMSFIVTGSGQRRTFENPLLRNKEGSHHNHIKKDQKHISSLLARSFSN